MTVLNGGCLCGRVRYTATGDAVFRNHCHCDDCRRESGTGHGSYLTLPKAGIALTGNPSVWSAPADSGKLKHRHFCPDCGTRVALGFDGAPDFMALCAGTLDDASGFRAQVVTYAARALPWDPPEPGLTAFAAMPG
jgi:hypothetical protein